MDRSELAELLGSGSKACTMARDALLGGADFTAPGGSANAAGLAGTYRVRMKATAAKGIATVGLADAVRALEAAGTSRVAGGFIGGPLDRWHFIVFVDYDSGCLLACTGVERAAV